MHIMKKSKLLAAGALSVALIAGGATPALASDESARASNEVISDPSRAVATDYGFDNRVADSTDYDLIQLLLTGTGQVADRHPELPAELGFTEIYADIDWVFVDSMITTFIGKYPEYSETWAPAVRSGDPIRITSGLAGFQKAFVDFVWTDDLFLEHRTESMISDGGPRPQAAVQSVWYWNAAVVANAAGVVTTMALAATVAVAAMGAAVVLGAAIWYLDDVESADGSFDMKQQRSKAINALAS